VIKTKLHKKDQLARLPGSALKYHGWRWWWGKVGWADMQTAETLPPADLQVEFSTYWENKSPLVEYTNIRNKSPLVEYTSIRPLFKNIR
jgi:hypothetical protein